MASTGTLSLLLLTLLVVNAAASSRSLLSQQDEVSAAAAPSAFATAITPDPHYQPLMYDYTALLLPCPVPLHKLILSVAVPQKEPTPFAQPGRAPQLGLAKCQWDQLLFHESQPAHSSVLVRHSHGRLSSSTFHTSSVCGQDVHRALSILCSLPEWTTTS